RIQLGSGVAMRFIATHLLLSTLAIVASAAPTCADEPTPSHRLCDSLQTLAPGEQRPVEFEGVYVETMEGSIFYRPEQPVCILDVEPATWVEFVSGYVEPPALRAELKRSGRAWVKFRGTLWGRGKLPPDDLSVPPMVAYAHRIANLRYGHMNSYSTKLVVEGAEFVRSVDSREPSYGAWSRERPGSPVPVLQFSSVPQYPETARKAGIEGVVVVEVEVKNGFVSRSTIQSGERLLAESVQENIATWRFAEAAEGAFSSVFIFELHPVATDSDKNPKQDLHLPRFARISAARHGW
ncbi:MAG: energy transducer TonB, partial [Thermoanaerobaculia bacterium]